MANKHPLEDIVKEMSGEFKDLREEAKRSKVTPLGKEKVTKQELRNRLGQLSPEGRGKMAQQMINDMGLDKFMEALRESQPGT